jgi:hypothetical protein
VAAATLASSSSSSVVLNLSISTFSSWSAFNQALSKCDPDLTTVGYMPLLQAPVHDFGTLNTVVQQCMHISEKLGKKYTVITVDQALYFKLMDLKCCVLAFPCYSVFQIALAQLQWDKKGLNLPKFRVNPIHSCDRLCTS